MWTRAPWHRKNWIALCVSLGVSALLTSCGLFEELPPIATATPGANTNLLQNPSFENGREAWHVLEQPGWVPFEVSDTVAHSGSHSASMALDDTAEFTGTRIVGAIQDVRPSEFPEFLSGFYRVEEWDPGTTFQYMQFVVVVRGAGFGDGIPIHEIRFPIAGIELQPFTLSNAEFLFLSREAPAIGEWTYFSYPISEAFQRKWGRVPAGFDSIEFFFEVRYDFKTADDPAGVAQVYYDDLYVGPQIGNPNRPPDD